MSVNRCRTAALASAMVVNADLETANHQRTQQETETSKMSVSTHPPQGDTPAGQTEWVSKAKAVAYLRNKGFEAVTFETLKGYAYKTGQLPKPKVIGKRAYWRVADLDKLVESL